MKGRTTSAPKKVEKAAATKSQSSGDGAVDSDALSDIASTGTTERASSARSAPTREQISERAYELYLARGSEPGHEAEDWLTAESELRQ